MAKPPFDKQLIADCGISMGDEGKGRLIPEIAAELRAQTGRTDPIAVVLKVNGGANSGHTCGGLKLNLFPAAVIDPSVPCLAIGAGVVADPRKIHWEACYIEHGGYAVKERLLIDERAMVSDLTHRLLDLAWEEYRVRVLGAETRGSTGRGISPAYCEETAQFQIHYGDIRNGKDWFARTMCARIERACATIQHVCRVSEDAWEAFFDILTDAERRANALTLEAGAFPESEFDFARFRGAQPFTLDTDLLIETYWDAGVRLTANIGDVREAVLRALRDGRYVVGEFGQSFWLDKRFGFSPNVTASHTYTPELFNSGGIPVQPVHTFGVCKAYDTKVGTHIYISRMPDGHPLAEKLKAVEFGTSTGRQRMVGWFDAVEKGDTLRYGGFQDLMINKLDVLTYSGDWQGGELLICTAYRAPDGAIHRHVPRDGALHSQLQPQFRQLPGWGEDLSEVRRWADLPANARRYVAAMMHAMIEVAANGDMSGPLPNLRYLGVGPDPSQIITDIPETAELIAMDRDGVD